MDKNCLSQGVLYIEVPLYFFFLSTHSLPILLFFFDIIDSPFCLQNFFFYLAAHLAQFFANQGLATADHEEGKKGKKQII